LLPRLSERLDGMEVVFGSESILSKERLAAAGSLRFRLLRGRPSHEKLYLLCGPSGSRVLTGSANLGRAAFEGRQHEILVVFDDESASRLFESYYQCDWKDSVPVAPESLIAVDCNGALAARDAPLPLEEGPIVRALD